MRSDALTGSPHASEIIAVTGVFHGSGAGLIPSPNPTRARDGAIGNLCHCDDLEAERIHRHFVSGVLKVDAARVTEMRLEPLDALVEAAVDGDQRALGRLLRTLAPRVMKVARAVLGADHAELDDAVQEGLVAIVDALPAFRGECSVGHFAARVAARKCVTVRKRAARVRERRVELAREPMEPDAQRHDSAGLGAMRDLLETLSEEQAETLVLRFVLGMSLAEVASATAAPVNTVRSRLRLAKEALRRRIEADPDLAEALEVAR